MDENNINMEGGAPAMPAPKRGKSKKIIGWTIIAVVLVVIILAVLSRAQGPVEPQSDSTGQSPVEDNAQRSGEPETTGEAEGSAMPVDEGTEEMAAEQSETHIVSYSDSGFSPVSLEIKKGDTIVFSNQSGREVWPASALHPTHTVYPGSDIKKCGTEDAGVIFDACRGLAAGESWPFQFNEVGEWKYHNHLNPNDFGTIKVVE